MKAILVLTMTLVSTLHAQKVLVKPYIQPGDGSSLDERDVKVLTWVTDEEPGSFLVEYGTKGEAPMTAKVEVTPMSFGMSEGAKKKPENVKKEPAVTLDEIKEKAAEKFPAIVEREQNFLRYRAVLPDLPFDSEVVWRVKLGTSLVREAAVKTRATAQMATRFIVVGDMASNKPSQYSVAHQMGLAKPDFLIALGDIVYPGGRVIQYMNHFFPCYNDVETPGEKSGAPLMATVPIYPVVGNHDADSQKLPLFTDAFSCFYWFSVPKNGPGLGPWSLPLGKNDALAGAFRNAAGREYPALSHYSFDYGAAHFLVLDANAYSAKELPKLLPWIEKDLSSTRQKWKFVCMHQPAFHTSKEHYTAQTFRMAQPLFERMGVDIVFAGHVHNYQRSMPLKFVPDPAGRDKRGRVNGTLTLDRTFDGKSDTTPEGVIHIVSGGGGASLYSVDLEKTVASLQKEHPENYQPLTAKYVADYSFTTVDLSPERLVLRQINSTGKELDRIEITK